MATTAENEAETKSLSEIFQEGLNLYNNLGRIDEPTNSPNVQINVKKSMHLLEQATKLISTTGLFSRNETIDEVATADLKYLLLPALLGNLTLKLTSGDRKTIIDVADIYFKDFLQRCNDYGLSNYAFKDQKKTEECSSEFDQLCHSVNTRANKIQRFKEQKELKSKLEDLKTHFENEYADEEIKRNYFLTMLKLSIFEAVDELSSIEMERPILEHMAKLNKDQPKVKRPVQPLKPVIITKDEVQKAVFGAGYPSLATMTVQEFYDKRVQDGIFPNPNNKSSELSLQTAALAGITLNRDDEEDKKETAIENDDPQYLNYARNKDDFKDEHRRGWGNRMNRS